MPQLQPKFCEQAKKKMLYVLQGCNCRLTQVRGSVGCIPTPQPGSQEKKVMCCMSWTHTILDGDSWSPPAILQGCHTRAIRETDGDLSHLPLIETCESSALLAIHDSKEMASHFSLLEKKNTIFACWLRVGFFAAVESLYHHTSVAPSRVVFWT